VGGGEGLKMIATNVNYFEEGSTPYMCGCKNEIWSFKREEKRVITLMDNCYNSDPVFSQNTGCSISRCLMAGISAPIFMSNLHQEK